jgi:hypothetical protein
MAAQQLSRGAAAGALLGQDASDLVGFHGVTPVAQASGAALATIAITSATTGGFGFSTSAQAMALVDQVKALTSVLKAKGILTTV